MQFRKWLLIILAVGAVAPLVASAHSTQMPGEITLAQPSDFGPPVIIHPPDGYVIHGVPFFDWEDTEGAVSYQFQLSTSVSFTSGVQNYQVVNGTFSPPQWNMPDDDGIYYWRVRAYNGTLYSDWTEQRQYEIETIPPVATVLMAPASGSTFTGTLPTFSWEPVSDAGRYEVSVYEVYGGNRFDERVDASVTSFTPGYDVSLHDIYLYPGTYRWTVTVIDEAGNRSTGNTVWEFTLVSPEDAAPDLYLYGGPPDYQVQLRWSMIDWASVYHIQVANDPDFSQIVRENNTLVVPEYAYFSFIYGGKYYWRVRAGQGNDVWGAWSETSSLVVSSYSYFTRTPAPPPTETPYYTPIPRSTLTPSPTFTPTATFTPSPTATVGG